MSNRRESSFVNILGFSDDANKLVNKAIYFSQSERCSTMNSIHLFLALLEREDIGKKILDYMDTTFDMVYSSYQMMAESGDFGTFNGNITPDRFEQDLTDMLVECSGYCAMRGKHVTVNDIVCALVDTRDDTLDRFLDYIGISFDEIAQIVDSEFIIPEELNGIVEDMNDTLAKKPMKISNVDKYTDEMIEILNRKLKSNPCLVGEAGVGKTTIVYSLVNRILEGNVPDSMKDTHVVYINGALLTSGTRYRGDFEERMKSLIEWASSKNVILFLDEVHTFINSGKTSEDSADTAGNIIKKHLSDGSIKVIGATTLKEYHKFIEGDSAFDRRLQKVIIKEPTVDEAIDMIKNTISDYARFHNVFIPEDVIETAVKLSDTYIKDKHLPDKAYTILDQASAHVKLTRLNKKLNCDDIADTVSKITGINVNKLTTSDTANVLKLKTVIQDKIIGQDDAVTTVCNAIKRAKAGVHDMNKPMASFMFVGPTGVGKTELCKVLSKEVALGDAAFIKFDMSEYSSKESVSKLIGAAPGYVGYGEGGQLTEKIKHNPYSIVLFDEIEKADSSIYNIFLQILDEGKLTDNTGTTVDFSNCIIVMTSNAGYGADGTKGSLGFNKDSKKETARDLEKKAKEALEETFRPEFLNRLDNIVVFNKLSKDNCREITKLSLNKLYNRLLQKDIVLKFNKSIIDRITEGGYSDKYGARNINREIQDVLEDKLADEILLGSICSGDKVTVSWKNDTVVLTKKN